VNTALGNPGRDGAHGWILYMVRSADNRLYTGITTDLPRRLAEHNSCGRRRAKALRGRTPVELVFRCGFDDRSQASAAEYRVKQLRRTHKDRLIAGELSIQSLLYESEQPG